VSAPYFHNGIAATLQEAIRHYETVGLPGVPAAGAFTDGSETVFVETATAGTSVGGCTSTKVWKDGKLVSQAPGRCGAIAGGVAEDRPRAAATAMPDSAAKHPGEDVAEEIFDFPDLVDRINLTDTERADLEAFLKKVGGKPPAIAAP
ncbi:MAG: hypothetical protein FJZ00_03560, partial [Candidatus Sericytochromatia bacterium]|nr:hypothetical protein [Candidatus Tanganyikabacteria bacterium]